MASDAIPAREDSLDETIEQSFPASDPPANTVVTGVKPGHAARRPTEKEQGRSEAEAVNGGVRDNARAQRFEISLAGQTAFLRYEQDGARLVLIHTEVPPTLRGRGLANVLAKFALDAAH